MADIPGLASLIAQLKALRSAAAGAVGGISAVKSVGGGTTAAIGSISGGGAGKFGIKNASSGGMLSRIQANLERSREAFNDARQLGQAAQGAFRIGQNLGLFTAPQGFEHLLGAPVANLNLKHNLISGIARTQEGALFASSRALQNLDAMTNIADVLPGVGILGKAAARAGRILVQSGENHLRATIERSKSIDLIRQHNLGSFQDGPREKSSTLRKEAARFSPLWDWLLPSWEVKTLEDMHQSSQTAEGRHKALIKKHGSEENLKAAIEKSLELRGSGLSDIAEGNLKSNVNELSRGVFKGGDALRKANEIIEGAGGRMWNNPGKIFLDMESGRYARRAFAASQMTRAGDRTGD